MLVVHDLPFFRGFLWRMVLQGGRRCGTPIERFRNSSQYLTDCQRLAGQNVGASSWPFKASAWQVPAGGRAANLRMGAPSP